MNLRPEMSSVEATKRSAGTHSQLSQTRQPSPEHITHPTGAAARGGIAEPQSGRDLIALSSSRAGSLLKDIRHVALDMDGTIYRGNTLFDDTIPFLSLLGKLAIGHTFLTNNSSKSIGDYVTHLRNMGIQCMAEDFFTSTQASIIYLRELAPPVRRLFVLGTDSMGKEVSAAGFALTADDPSDEPDAVLVGFDTSLTYARLCRAAYWIKQGKPFIASHPDRICPTDQPNVLVDCGSVCAALKEATGRGPDAVLGKPDSRMLLGLLRRHRLQPENLMMVGDRLYTDMEMARRVGALGALVLTGEASLEEARKAGTPPDLIVSNLEVLGRRLTEAIQKRGPA